MVEDAGQLAEAMLGLLSDPAKRKERGQAALGVAREATGGMERTMGFLLDKKIIENCKMQNENCKLKDGQP